MAEEEQTIDTKRFVSLDKNVEQYTNALKGVTDKSLSIDEALKRGKLAGISGDAISGIKKFISGAGLGGMSVDKYLRKSDDSSFVEKYGLGSAKSYKDFAIEALQSDPNFDPSDETLVNEIASDLMERGFKDNRRGQEKIQEYVTSKSIQDRIDRELNPQNYLEEGQGAANLETANRLIQQTLGTEDPDLADFLAQRIAEGESAFELSQFLQTTPQYMEKKAAQDRESINQELLSSEEEVFRRAQPQIISSYMRAGRLNSSGLDSAISNARAELANQRQGLLTGYAREDVVGARNAAFQNYLRQSEPGYQQKFNLQNAQNYQSFQQPYNQLQRTYALNDQARAREYALSDYDRQQSDFNRYLSDYRSQGRENALYGLLGAGISAGGSYLARPRGA